MLHYVCKYTPIEMLRALGADTRPLEGMREGFDRAEQVAGPNICGFGKTVLEAVFAGDVHELVLTNCCDTIRTVHDILAESGKLDFLYILDLPHCADACARERFAEELRKLAYAYESYSSNAFDEDRFRAACQSACRGSDADPEPYIGVLGARAGSDIVQVMQEELQLPVRNLTCVAARVLPESVPDSSQGEEALIDG